MRHTFRALFVVLSLLVAGSTSTAFAQPSPHNPGVMPITGRFAGLTYGEWSARWWQWYWSTLTADSPSLDKTGALASEGQSGPVWFLTWPLVDPSAVRRITVPAGKAILFPATNHDSLLDPLPPNATLDDRRKAAEQIFDWISFTAASVDGVPIKDLTSYAAVSPAYDVEVPANNIFGIPPGKYGPTFSAGYYILLRPLSVGHHTIEFSFDFFWPPAGKVLSLNTTYEIDVVGRN
jgi:hypothetical protein